MASLSSYMIEGLRDGREYGPLFLAAVAVSLVTIVTITFCDVGRLYGISCSNNKILTIIHFTMISLIW